MTEPAATSIRRHIPNALTISRIVLAVAFFAVLTPFRYSIYSDHSVFGDGPHIVRLPLLVAAVLFVVAALTDALDGHLARRWNVVSMFGRVMDPVADKVLVIGAFVFLAGPSFDAGWDRTTINVAGVESWMVIVILARELVVTSLRAMAESRGIAFSATLSGKLKMILQSIAVPLVLLLLAFSPPVRAVEGGWFDRSATGNVILAVVWLTVLVTAWSGVPYILRASRVLRSNPGAPTADR